MDENYVTDLGLKPFIQGGGVGASDIYIRMLTVERRCMQTVPRMYQL